MPRLAKPTNATINRVACMVASGLMGPQEAEELNALAQAALHHFPAAEHFADDLPDFAGAEVEAFVEYFHAVEDLFLRQMRVTDRGQLYATVIDQIDRVI